MSKLARGLGCWYSNNQIHPQILGSSLASIELARQKSQNAEVQVRTCTWTRIESSPFKGYVTHFQLGVHFGIALQILRVMYEEERAGNSYDWISFLEHDVLYPCDYFDRVSNAFSENPNGIAVSNLDYIGLNETGWLSVNQRHEPMHQLSLKYSFAQGHFEALVRKCILDGADLLEPHDKSGFLQIPYCGEQPSVHINHSRHFTSHYAIYEKESSLGKEHAYWGKSQEYYPKEEHSL